MFMVYLDEETEKCCVTIAIGIIIFGCKEEGETVKQQNTKERARKRKKHEEKVKKKEGK